MKYIEKQIYKKTGKNNEIGKNDLALTGALFDIIGRLGTEPTSCCHSSNPA